MASTLRLLRNIEQALTVRDNPAIATDLQELVALGGGAPFLRASGLAGCGRRQSYAARGVARTPNSPESLIMMLQGDWGEVGMRRLIADAGYIIRDEQLELQHFDEEGREVLRGHIDGIIGMDQGLIETEWSLWEMKMMSAFRYKQLVAKGVKGSTPDYYDQCQIYMGLLRRMQEPIESCIFTAVAKDPSSVNMGRKRDQPRIQPIYIEEIPFDQGRFDALIYRAEDIHSVVRQGGLYKRERQPGKDWDCSERFCPFYSVCDPANALREAA
jgi:hypothetical protein